MAKGYKTGGRQHGTPNKLTRAFKDAVQIAYGAIGGDKAFATWAEANPTEFYKIAARLIPQEMRESGNTQITVRILSLAAVTNSLGPESAAISNSPPRSVRQSLEQRKLGVDLTADGTADGILSTNSKQ